MILKLYWVLYYLLKSLISYIIPRWRLSPMHADLCIRSTKAEPFPKTCRGMKFRGENSCCRAFSENLIFVSYFTVKGMCMTVPRFNISLAPEFLQIRKKCLFPTMQNNPVARFKP